MARPLSSLNNIDAFLSQKRIAMIGLSRNPKDFTHILFREMVRRGYDMVAVNPNAAEIEGRRCYAHLSEIEPQVDAVLLMTSASASEDVVHECAAAGVAHVWFYRATGVGAVNTAAVEFCRSKGMNVVAGECPYMFWPHNGFHVIHGFVRKISGTFPKYHSA